jgi:hypothetical protein
MRIKTFIVPLIAGTIFLSACKKNSVSLSYTNAKGEVPQLGNLNSVSIIRWQKIPCSMPGIRQNIFLSNPGSPENFVGKVPMNWSSLRHNPWILPLLTKQRSKMLY